MNVIVQVAELDLQPALQEALHLGAFGREEDLDVFPVRILFMEDVFECGSHDTKLEIIPFIGTSRGNNC